MGRKKVLPHQDNRVVEMLVEGKKVPVRVLSEAEHGAYLRAQDARDEASRKLAKVAANAGDIAVARRDGSLGDEVIKIAQAMILCGLPYSEQQATRITRTARLGDGSTLSVTYSASAANVPIPYGQDRHLLAWIFDRAIQGNSPFVAWDTASEYLQEMGEADGGSQRRALAKRFERIAGLAINIQRRTDDDRQGIAYTVIERHNLPTSVSRRREAAGQQVIPELRDRHGFKLTPGLFEDILRFHVALPRRLWAEMVGPSQVQDMVLWLFARCYAAASESVIPWEALREQFGSDSNPRRTRAYARQAMKYLQAIWPEARIGEDSQGIRVAYTPTPLLLNDSSANRVRRLKAK